MPELSKSDIVKLLQNNTLSLLNTHLSQEHFYVTCIQDVFIDAKIHKLFNINRENNFTGAYLELDVQDRKINISIEDDDVKHVSNDNLKNLLKMNLDQGHTIGSCNEYLHHNSKNVQYRIINANNSKTKLCSIEKTGNEFILNLELNEVYCKIELDCVGDNKLLDENNLNSVSDNRAAASCGNDCGPKRPLRFVLH